MTAFVCDVVRNGYYGNQWVVIFDGEMWVAFIQENEKSEGNREMYKVAASQWLYNHMMYKPHHVYSLF